MNETEYILGALRFGVKDGQVVLAIESLGNAAKDLGMEEIPMRQPLDYATEERQAELPGSSRTGWLLWEYAFSRPAPWLFIGLCIWVAK